MLVKQHNKINLAYIASAVDVVSAAAVLFLMNGLTRRLSQPSGVNALLLAAVFGLFCLGVILVRRLATPYSDAPERLSRNLRTVLALFFALMFSLCLAWQLGFFASSRLVDTRELGEGGSAIYFVFAPGAWLGISLLYVLALAFNVSPTVVPGARRAAAYALAGVLTANVMLIVMAAQLHAVLSPFPGGPASLLIGLLLAVLFLPPRLLLIERANGLRSPTGRRSLIGFVLLIGFCAVLPMLSR